jgi:hypothetical protein
MNALDAAIIRTVRRELGKRHFDANRVDIQAHAGRVTLTGVATRLRDQPDANLKSEMDMLQKLCMRDRNIQDVVINVRLVEEEAVKEEHDSRARVRH